VAITGSTGLAGAITDLLTDESANHGPSGRARAFSVTNVRLEDDIRPRDFDIFINQAHQGFSQVELLFRFFDAWKADAGKYIINMSSRAAQPNISKGYMYAAQKAALNQLAANLTYNSDKRCRITTINLGLLEHALPSLSYTEVAEAVKTLIDLPEHIEIADMTLQHAANYCEIQAQKSRILAAAE
tara:strand:+ start:2104 stop:2661 length:558 start_codon:yes stop_codon:yes gene_type:complete